ncbi:MAG: ABC transporter ATP-binding protein [Kiritimatiellia bacterium]
MLELIRVSKSYGTDTKKVQAVHQVSLFVRPGEVVCIRGPSGCGKTTLLLMSGALLRPTAGTVRVDNVDPYSLSPEERSVFRGRKIGFIFQQFHLIPYLSVIENVLAPTVPNPRPDARERALQLIRHFGLEARIAHLPGELSVGERQRVALARALLNEPKLVLADEPTGNLDPDNAIVVLDALREYARGGGAVLLVTHDPYAAERADRTLLMGNGRLAVP